MKILVTGGAGFIGSNIVDRLISLDHQVVIVDNLSTGKRDNLQEVSGFTFYEIDLDSPRLEEVFAAEQITHVIHHAAQIDVQRSIKEPLKDIQSNITGTVNLLEHCRQYGVEKVVYASSAAVYGQPDYLPVDEAHPIKAMSPYGISKHTPEHYLRMYRQLYGLDFTIFRYANVYGPRQDPRGEGGVISIFTDRMLAGRDPVIYGDGEQTRDFIYVGDIVEANIKALTTGSGELLNLSCNTQNSINDVYHIITGLLSRTGNYDLKPRYTDTRKGDIRHSCLDNTRAREVLGWSPRYHLEGGLARTTAYYARQRGITEVADSLEKQE